MRHEPVVCPEPSVLPVRFHQAARSRPGALQRAADRGPARRDDPGPKRGLPGNRVSSPLQRRRKGCIVNDDRAKIAVVEDDRILRQQITWSLKSDYQISEAGSRDEAMGIMRTESPDLVLLDMHLPPSGRMEEGLSLIGEARRTGTDTVFIMMSGSDSQESAQKAIREGAYDFFRKPFDLSELRLIIQRALDRLRIERENRQLRQELQSRYAFRNIIGSSPAMRRVFEAIRKVSESSTSAMLRGESGTGKELGARAVHFNSPRRDGRFIGVNCGAIPATLVESELFGHERGAFTGAISEREGRFELAHEGTLFLDEVGTLSLDLQTRLLQEE